MDKAPLHFSRPLTHPSLHIRDAHDAHVVLEAVRLNLLPLIKRRLVSGEREQLCSGNVFVWEEAEDEGGLLRWTDGRRWSQSRMRGDYLFYEEKVATTQDEKDAKAARRAHRAANPSAIIPPATRRKDRPSKLNGLTKQTYSAVVLVPGNPTPKKWHVVAYFMSDEYTRLPVIEDYEYLRNIRVPEGVYLTNKTTASRSPVDAAFSFSSRRSDRGVGTAKLERIDTMFVPSSPSSSSSTMSPLTPVSPLSPPSPGSPPMRQSSLPTLSTLAFSGHLPLLGRTYPDYDRKHRQRPYTPLTAEDRRALERLRVSL